MTEGSVDQYTPPTIRRFPSEIGFSQEVTGVGKDLESGLRVVRTWAESGHADIKDEYFSFMGETKGIVGIVNNLNTAGRTTFEEREKKSSTVDTGTVGQDVENTRSKLFLSAIHDLRTPLTTILGMSQLAERRALNQMDVIERMEVQPGDRRVLELAAIKEYLEKNPDRLEKIQNALERLAAQTLKASETLGIYPVEEVTAAQLIRKLEQVMKEDNDKDTNEEPETLSLKTSINIDPDIQSETTFFVASDFWMEKLFENIKVNTINRGYAGIDVSREGEVIKNKEGQEVKTFGRMDIWIRKSEDGKSLVLSFADFGNGYPKERLSGFILGGTDHPEGSGVGMATLAEAAQREYSASPFITSITPKNVKRDETGKVKYIISKEQRDGKIEFIQKDVDTNEEEVITSEQAEVKDISFAGALTEVIMPIQTIQELQERRTKNAANELVTA